MDQTSHKVLRFDRFALDLTRGCLRRGEQEVELRPKAFQVLTYLAVNAGRLVPKQELIDAVWADVAVSDESLVQCIRELRQKLGDEKHGLIKTVPRRGYLLDGTAAAAAVHPLSAGRALDLAQRLWGLVAGFGSPHGTLRADPMGQRRTWVAAGGLLCALLVGLYLSAPLAGLFSHPASPPRPASRLFTAADAMRVAGIAVKKQLPLPAFQIREPAHDVPGDVRRFVGIWVSDTGWIGSNRQFMLIVTYVDRDGMAEGYTASGPPQPKSLLQNPAFYSAFKARISRDSLSYADTGSETVASLTVQNRIEYKVKRRDGTLSVVSLDPVWTLVDAEHGISATANPSDDR